MTNIVGVQLQRDGRPNEYYGSVRQYETDLKLSVGDKVLAPIEERETVAIVRSILGLRTIEKLYVPEGVQ